MKAPEQQRFLASVVEKSFLDFEYEEAVLVRNKITDEWQKRWFVTSEKTFYITMNMPYDSVDSLSGKWIYCIPFEENSHLEGVITEENHGAISR